MVRLGRSFVVVLPKDWVRGMELGKGDLLELTYNGMVHIRPEKEPVASAAEGTSLSGRARQLARPTGADEGGLVGADG